MEETPHPCTWVHFPPEAVGVLHPNPLFPPTPRPGVLLAVLPFAASVLILVGGIGAIGWFVSIEQRETALWLLILPTVGTLASIVTALPALHRLDWRSGRIVPARVVIPHIRASGGPLHLWGVLLPGSALLSLLFPGEPGMRMTVEYVECGVAYNCSPEGANGWRGDAIIWILLGRRATVLDGSAPPEFRRVPVPPEIKQQLVQTLNTLRPSGSR